MRILVICSGHTLDDDRVTRKQAASLANLGHDVTVCAWRRYDFEEPHVRLIDLHRLRTGQDNTADRKERLSRKDRLMCLGALHSLVLREKPDLLIAHELETAALACWIRLRRQVPYVFDVHEMYDETVRNRAPRGFRFAASRVVRLLLRVIARKAETITVVSPIAARFFNEIAPGIPIEQLHNSPLVEYFPYNDLEGSVPIIVHEGTLSMNRGAMQMLEALSIVKKTHDFKFLVLGSIVQEIRDQFLSKIRQLGLQDIVEMPGRLPWTEFGKVEASGQIGLICMQPLPNNMKSLSNKLYNYMACGLAVIGPKKSATEELLLKYQAGLCVDTTKPDEIAEAVVYLLKNPEIRRGMAARGRRAIEQDLGWHCMEIRMQKVYSRIAKRLEDKKQSGQLPAGDTSEE